MKKVIDAIKEIINKDASTQTEPVTIIENEEDMKRPEEQMEGQQLSDLKLKRDVYAVEIRKAKRDEELSKIRNEKLLSGQEHVEEQARFEEELEAAQQIKPDASFYDKCKRYVEQVYPEEIESSNFYSYIIGTLTRPIVKKDHNPNFNVEEFSGVLKNIFRSEIEDDIAEETKKDLLTRDAAGIYVVCAEDPDIQKFMREKNAENFTDPGSLRNTIQEYLVEVTYHELAGEVFNILDNTGVN